MEDDSTVAWDEVDDIMLENTKNIDDPHFKLLRKYKGDKRVARRVAFKSIELPFDFDVSYSIWCLFKTTKYYFSMSFFNYINLYLYLISQLQIK